MINFPKDFTWGAATASFQVEGAFDKDGKGPSIWDAFTQIPNRIENNDNAEIACGHYELYKEDVALMKEIGLKAYRFSISWPRIFPEGKGKVNQAGIDFYNNLINELLENDIQPFVTLYHWDLPLALQLEEDGWLNDNIVSYFTEYARVCFESFGDRVKNWMTFNEPWVVSVMGYGNGEFAPGRVSNTEPYIVAHNILKAHAKTVDMFRKEFSHQSGRIGIANNSDWREPLTDSEADKEAAERSLEFFLGWFADPIYKGKYPDSMRRILGSRLPEFTKEESELLKGSSDFFGLNHYTTLVVSDAGNATLSEDVKANGGISLDQQVNFSIKKEWKFTDMKWPIVPDGCKKLLQWIDKRYDKPEIIITENGCAFDDKPIDEKVNDSRRIEFHKAYLAEAAKAIESGVNLSGYFLWSLMDNFEWSRGFDKRFGICYVDYDSLKRIKKSSATWYSNTIKDNGFNP